MNHCKDCTWWLPNRPEFQVDKKALCLNEKIGIITLAELGCDFHLAANSVEVNVPQHTKRGITMEPNLRPVDGPVEILIVTHAKDVPWLEFCLRGLAKHCSGFQGVTIAHPLQEADVFVPLRKRFDIRLYAYPEIPSKGMLQHMVKMAEADMIVPTPTKYVMHLDADCIYHTPTTPEDYFCEGKPVWLIRSWDSLSTEDPNNPGSKVVSDCFQWKKPTDEQVGFDTPFYTMCRHPTVMPIAFYRRYRDHLENVQHKPFEVYMVSGRNEFPQDRMDWTAMGAWAYRHMRQEFYWLNIEMNPPPKDRQRTYWSHGGIHESTRSEMEGFLS